MFNCYTVNHLLLLFVGSLLIINVFQLNLAISSQFLGGADPRDVDRGEGSSEPS